MMKDKVKVIIFDADDTLWDNQTYFDSKRPRHPRKP